MALPETVKIAALMGDKNNPFWSGMERDYSRLAPERGFEVECFYTYPPGEPEAQAWELARLGELGFPAIIVNPLDSSNLAPVINRLARQGIKILDVGSKTDRSLVGQARPDYVAVRTVDFRQQGILGGRYLASLLQLGDKIALIQGRPTAAQSMGRCSGAEEELRAAGMAVAARRAAHFDRDQGREAAAGLLEEIPDLAGIFCANDHMALGALQAAQEAGREGLPIVGVDLIPEAAQSVAQGGLVASVAFSREEVARQALRAVKAALTGAVWPDAYSVQSTLVTKENVKEFLS